MHPHQALTTIRDPDHATCNSHSTLQMRAASVRQTPGAADSARGLPATRCRQRLDTDGRLARHIAHEQRGLKTISAINERSKAPKDCQDLALLAGEYYTHGHRALELKASPLLELLQHFDVFRRPQRFEALIAACGMDAWGGADWNSATTCKLPTYAVPCRRLAPWRYSRCRSRACKAPNRARHS